MISGFVARMSRINEAFGQKMRRLGDVETLGSLLTLLIYSLAFWAFAWNAHIIWPWLENLIGLAPSDIDSPGKIRWRRMWSTALSVSCMVLFVTVYCLKLYDRRRGRISSSAASEKRAEKRMAKKEKNISNPPSFLNGKGGDEK